MSQFPAINPSQFTNLQYQPIYLPMGQVPWYNYPLPQLAQIQQPQPVQPNNVPLEREEHQEFQKKLIAPVKSKRQRKYNRTWKRNEIKQLFEVAQQYCKQKDITLNELKESDFQDISKKLSQTPTECMYKMQEIVKSGTLRPGAWSEEEDQILLGLIQRRYKKWGHIADTINRDYYNNMKIRSGKQCKERWNNHLNPEINRSPWSIKEELILLKQHRKIGNKWSLIALKLNNRTESSIKNKIKSLLNKGYMELYSVNSQKKILDQLIAKKQQEIELEEGNEESIDE